LFTKLGQAHGMSVALASQNSAQAFSDRRPIGRPIHFVYHVPKCAGQTIDRHLASVLPGSYYRLKKRRGAGRLFKSRYDLAGMPDPQTTSAVGGHFLGISLEALFPGRPVKRSILLRDPVSHLISYYNYRMMRYISQGLQPYSFETAYGATHRNFITNYILRNFLELSRARVASLSDHDKYDLASAFLSTFWFVGDYSRCDDLIGALAGRLGIEPKAPRRNTQAEWESRVAWDPLALEDLSPVAIAQIRRENLVDQRLWETWREAKEETASIRPRPLTGPSGQSFVSSEAVRFVNQLTRRIQRRWGDFDGSEATPLAGGGSVVPVQG
jgi:hypothetical protein